ncbi:MAG: RNA polymerase sigma factor [bacterium]
MSPSDEKFPKEFGSSPDDFLERYGALIYKILCEHTSEHPGFEIEDLFNDFFIHIAENNFTRLRSFRGVSMPTTYLGRILRNFICDQYRKEKIKRPFPKLSEIERDTIENIPVPPGMNKLHTDELIQNALKKIFTRISPQEKLIFDLFSNEGMTAKEIAHLLGIKIKLIYKINEKVKKLIKDELEECGITKENWR